LTIALLVVTPSRPSVLPADRDRRDLPETPPTCRGFEQAEPVDVNGRPGRYGDRAGTDSAGNSWPAVCWSADDRTLITVTDDGLGLSRAGTAEASGGERLTVQNRRT
jgi:hypothetical protein